MKRIFEIYADLQPVLVAVLIAALVVVLGAGCVSTGNAGESEAVTRDFVVTGALTAAGGYIGARESSNKARGAAIGAGAGFIAGETINFFTNKAQREAWLAGYEKGQSNAAKQQYWIARANQQPVYDDGYEEALYEISIPQTDRDGVRREATTRVIRVVMPREKGTAQ